MFNSYMQSRLPWNWKTPLGYSLGFFLEGCALLFSTLLSITIICFFVGSSWIIITFVGDITKDLKYLNIDKPNDSNEHHTAAQQPFYNIVKLYADVKELSNNFNINSELTV